MKNFFVIIFMIALFYGYDQYRNGKLHFGSDDVFLESSSIFVDTPVRENQPVQTNTSRYSCDGRQHCSQMSSCEEATYFIRHCPNTKMDGDNNGVPCEKQWCR